MSPGCRRRFIWCSEAAKGMGKCEKRTFENQGTRSKMKKQMHQIVIHYSRPDPVSTPFQVDPVLSPFHA